MRPLLNLGRHQNGSSRSGRHAGPPYITRMKSQQDPAYAVASQEMWRETRVATVQGGITLMFSQSPKCVSTCVSKRGSWGRFVSFPVASVRVQVVGNRGNYLKRLG